MLFKRTRLDFVYVRILPLFLCLFFSHLCFACSLVQVQGLCLVFFFKQKLPFWFVEDTEQKLDVIKVSAIVFKTPVVYARRFFLFCGNFDLAFWHEQSQVGVNLNSSVWWFRATGVFQFQRSSFGHLRFQ